MFLRHPPARVPLPQLRSGYPHSSDAGLIVVNIRPDYRPSNTGGRFSEKALRASAWSRVPRATA